MTKKIQLTFVFCDDERWRLKGQRSDLQEILADEPNIHGVIKTFGTVRETFNYLVDRHTVKDVVLVTDGHISAEQGAGLIGDLIKQNKLPNPTAFFSGMGQKAYLNEMQELGLDTNLARFISKGDNFYDVWLRMAVRQKAIELGLDSEYLSRPKTGYARVPNFPERFSKHRHISLEHSPDAPKVWKSPQSIT